MTRLQTRSMHETTGCSTLCIYEPPKRSRCAEAIQPCRSNGLRSLGGYPSKPTSAEDLKTGVDDEWTIDYRACISSRISKYVPLARCATLSISRSIYISSLLPRFRNHIERYPLLSSLLHQPPINDSFSAHSPTHYPAQP